MASLYVTSSEGAAGKTTICAGVAKHLLADGKKVGFMKPTTPDKAIDADGVFMKRILALGEPIEDICPVIADPSKIKEAYAKIFSGKDVVIVESMGGQGSGESPRKIAEALGAKAIIVESYSSNYSPSINSYKEWGEYLLGVVLNRVPGSKLEQVRKELSAKLGGAGIKLLGVLPEDRVLFTLTVGELATHLQGKILSSTEETGELVENFMLGAMCVDSGLEYFGRKSNKAVVVRAERPDMQLAALETSTRCLVLTGTTVPLPAVLLKAKEKKVPLISAREGVGATVANIEGALGKVGFNQDRKLPRLIQIMKQNFDFQAIYQGLGLAG